MIDFAFAVAHFRKAKTRRGKRFLENRQSKVVENDKTAIIVKGGKTNQTVTDVLADLYALKKPLALRMKRFDFNHFVALQDQR